MRGAKKGAARPVSAWVDPTREEKARREDLASLLTEMRAEGRPATAEDDEWARGVLGL